MLWCMWLLFLAMIINLVDGSRWARFSWPARERWSSSLAIRARFSNVLLSCFFRAMAHVFLSVFLRYILCCIRIQLSCFCWHRGVPSFVGVVLGTPSLLCSTTIAWRFLWFRLIINWDVTLPLSFNHICSFDQCWLLTLTSWPELTRVDQLWPFQCPLRD